MCESHYFICICMVIAITTDVSDAQVILSKNNVVTHQNGSEEATAVI